MKFKTLSFIFQIRCSVMNEKVQLLEASIELLKEKVAILKPSSRPMILVNPTSKIVSQASKVASA